MHCGIVKTPFKEWEKNALEISELLKYAGDTNCSDIHITAGTHLALRRYGRLFFLDDVPTISQAESMIMSFLSEEEEAKVREGHDIDVGCRLPDRTRIRVNVYHQRGNLAASIRMLYRNIPPLRELGLPSILESFASLPRGMVLVTGPTGSGKSTTLASMMEYINETYDRHIMTIEDPIEYILDHKQALIHQREVGADVPDFHTALRSALREDPDIIMVGEMRDYPTIAAAVTAAETGHLVFSTLHTSSAAQTVERIIDSTPVENQSQIRLQLANVLEGVITQTLIPRKDGQGRVVATEIMAMNYAIRNLIRDNKVHAITDVIQSGAKESMHTMNMDLARLYKEKKISRENTIQHSYNVRDLLRLLESSRSEAT
ncbi:MAG: PilT/PilU family type 4a pilus ATPase [Lachnospiraceae bacterium]|nr:PilT/PilU family type 4a pilus ATPase [Lachnospiraceae bacterium]